MKVEELKPDKVLCGPLFSEPVQVIVTLPMDAAVKLVGRGLQTGKVVDIVLTEEKLKLLETSPDIRPVSVQHRRKALGGWCPRAQERIRVLK